MMVRFDGIDDSRIDAITSAEFSADNRMCAFRVMVHGLADIMQQTGSFGYFRVRADFSCQYSGNHG